MYTNRCTQVSGHIKNVIAIICIFSTLTFAASRQQRQSDTQQSSESSAQDQQQSKQQPRATQAPVRVERAPQQRSEQPAASNRKERGARTTEVAPQVQQVSRPQRSADPAAQSQSASRSNRSARSDASSQSPSRVQRDSSQDQTAGLDSRPQPAARYNKIDISRDESTVSNAGRNQRSESSARATAPVRRSVEVATPRSVASPIAPASTSTPKQSTVAKSSRVDRSVIAPAITPVKPQASAPVQTPSQPQQPKVSDSGTQSRYPRNRLEIAPPVSRSVEVAKSDTPEKSVSQTNKVSKQRTGTRSEQSSASKQIVKADAAAPAVTSPDKNQTRNARPGSLTERNTSVTKTPETAAPSRNELSAKSPSAKIARNEIAPKIEQYAAAPRQRTEQARTGRDSSRNDFDRAGRNRGDVKTADYDRRTVNNIDTSRTRGSTTIINRTIVTNNYGSNDRFDRNSRDHSRFDRPVDRHYDGRWNHTNWYHPVVHHYPSHYPRSRAHFSYWGDGFFFSFGYTSRHYYNYCTWAPIVYEPIYTPIYDPVFVYEPAVYAPVVYAPAYAGPAAVVWPSYRRTVFYTSGPACTVSYMYPYHFRRYVFVSVGGYWPEYNYARYYWYGCHPYSWYGPTPTAYVIGDATNVYTYTPYTPGALVPGTTVAGVEVPDYDGLNLAAQKINAQAAAAAPTQPAEPSATDKLFDEGVQAFGKGDYAGAAEIFRQALRIDADDQILPFAYAQALFGANEYEKSAAVIYTALLEMGPRQQDVYYPRGLYTDETVLNSQIRNLERAVSMDPANSQLQLLLGYHYLGTGRLNEAASLLNSAKANPRTQAPAITLLNLLERVEAGQKKN